MEYHVLPGDSLVEEFKKTNIEGRVIVCREALIAGDVSADSLPEFWDQRARFVHTEYGEDEIVYHETVADELGRLLDMDEGDEVIALVRIRAFLQRKSVVLPVAAGPNGGDGVSRPSGRFV